MPETRTTATAAAEADIRAGQAAAEAIDASATAAEDAARAAAIADGEPERADEEAAKAAIAAAIAAARTAIARASAAAEHVRWDADDADDRLLFAQLSALDAAAVPASAADGEAAVEAMLEAVELGDF